MVAAIHKGSARDDTSMHLLRYLWFLVSHYDIDITTVHVAGVTNCTTDHLSRQQKSLFFSLNPQVDTAPTTLSPACGITKPGLQTLGNYSALLQPRFSTFIPQVL